MECWAVVHGAVMGFLEKGKQPDWADKKKGWPLPAPEVGASQGNTFSPEFPIDGVLIDIAIHEKRLDDVVSLYQQQKRKSCCRSNRDEEVARAVGVSHPELALAIWHQLAMNQIDQVKPSAYTVAATYLAKMHKVYQQTSQLTKWQVLISTLRHEHKRKIRLLEVLDGLGGCIRKATGYSLIKDESLPFSLVASKKARVHREGNCGCRHLV